VIPSTATAIAIWRDSHAEVLADSSDFAFITQVNSTYRKTLERILAALVHGNIEWTRIESKLKVAGCRMVEGAGSSVTFESGGRKMTLDQPYPGKEALRYRILAVREFLEKAGIKP